MPGQGDTPLDTGSGPSIGDRARYVRQVIEALDLDRVLLVGHSMGGGIASSAAVNNPRVVALGLLATIGAWKHKGLLRLPSFMPRLADRDWTWTLSRPLARQGFQAAGFPSYYDDASLRHTLRCAGALDFDEVARAHGAVKVPTLVAWAEDDPLIEPEVALDVVDRVPAGPRLRWPVGGHNIQKTHAQELGPALLGLIQTQMR